MRSYPADGYMSVVAYIQNHTFYNSHVPAGQMPPTPIAIAVHPTHLGFGSSCFPSHRAPSHPVAGFAAPNLAQIFRSSSGDIIFFVIPPHPGRVLAVLVVQCYVFFVAQRAAARVLEIEIPENAFLIYVPHAYLMFRQHYIPSCRLCAATGE